MVIKYHEITNFKILGENKMRLTDYIRHLNKIFNYEEIEMVSNYIEEYCISSIAKRCYGEDFEGLKDNETMWEYEVDIITDVLAEKFDRFLNSNDEIMWKIFRVYYPKNSPMLFIEEKSIREMYEDCYCLFTSDLIQAIHLYILDNIKEQYNCCSPIWNREDSDAKTPKNNNSTFINSLQSIFRKF